MNIENIFVETIAIALWRLDHPKIDAFSEYAPNDWNLWPEHGRNASLAQVDHSKDDYREQARAALKAFFIHLACSDKNEVAAVNELEGLLAKARSALKINSVVPCYRNPNCSWPACAADCDGRPGRPIKICDEKVDSPSKVETTALLP